MKKRGATQIKEIAERLGVSSGTVSIVLNGRGDEMRISKATQQRVWDAAKDMNYQPNIYARRLRSAAGEESGRVVAIYWNNWVTDDMMSRFFKGLYQAAKEKGNNVEYIVQMFDGDALSAWKQNMSSNRYSGIIVFGASDADVEFLNSTTFDLPLVLIGRHEQQHHCVYINDYEIGKSCAKLFCLRGHKKVGLISMRARLYGAMMRQMGFVETCAQNKLDLRDEWIREGESRDYLAGYTETKRLLADKDRPTAVFVMAPGQVLGVLAACKEAGLSVPEDIEVLTYGDNSIFPHFSPSVSSLHIPVETLAENALLLLILVIENGIDMPMSRVLTAEYAFRETCGGFPEESGESVRV